jgi:hypothetical protein
MPYSNVGLTLNGLSIATKNNLEASLKIAAS